MGEYPAICHPGRGYDKIRIPDEIQTGEMTKKEFNNRIQ